LLLGAHKKYLATVFCCRPDKLQSFFEVLNGLLQVDNVNSISLSKDVLFHLWIPAPGLMPEMNASF
jgi:hypothetical protein